MTRRRPLVPLLALAPLLLTGCAGGSPSASDIAAATGATTSPAAAARSGTALLAGSITVFAASSLAGTFTPLGKAFEAAHPGSHVAFDFAASSTLAQQIDSGAPADVFASASSTTMATAVTAHAVDPPRVFASNTAEIAVAPTSTGRVGRLADLARPGVTVALCQPEVPCGALAERVLAAAHLRVAPVTRGLDVKAVLATVERGEVDAGLVYVTDVRAAGSAVRGVTVPASVNASTRYPIATVTTSRQPALARAFTDLVMSPAGQQVLRQAGFSAP